MQSDMEMQDTTNLQATYTHVYILITHGCIYIMQSDIRMQILKHVMLNLETT